MRVLQTTSLLTVVLCLFIGACKDDTKSDPDETAKIEAPDYPASVDGLKQMGSDLIGAAKEGNDALITAIATKMQIPDYEKWLDETFGPKGARLVEDQKYMAAIAKGFPEMLQIQVKKGRTEVMASRFEAPGKDVKNLMNIVFKHMQKPVPLYVLRFVEPGKSDGGFSLWSFVHVDGTFRFLGKGYPLLDEAPTDDMERAFLELSDNEIEKIMKE